MIVSVAVPVFDTVTDCEAELPTVTDPKLTDVVLKERAGAPLPD